MQAPNDCALAYCCRLGSAVVVVVVVAAFAFPSSLNCASVCVYVPSEIIMLQIGAAR